MSHNFETIDSKAALGLSDIVLYIRWFFTGFVLSFVSIIISGLLLTQLPVMRLYSMKGESRMRFLTYFINITATGDEVIVGIGGFITVLVLCGLIGGGQVPLLLAHNYGLQLAHFESLCIFSSFLLLITSFLLNIVYKTLSYCGKNNSNPSEYDKTIEKLASKKEDGHDE